MLPDIFMRSQSLKKLYDTLCEPLREQFSLSQVQLDVLLFLANNPRYDTARDMVEKRHLAKSHISAAVEELVQRHMLERFYSENNRKTIHLRLLPGAMGAVDAGQKMQQQYEKLLLADFSPEEERLLKEMLGRIGGNAAAALEQLEKRR